MNIRTRAEAKALGLADLWDREMARRRVEPLPTYRSKTEARWARELESLVDRGEIAAFEYEPERLPLFGKRSYLPDFRVTLNDDRRVWCEVKGYRRKDGILKLESAAAKYRDTPFFLVERPRSRWSVRLVHPETGIQPANLYPDEWRTWRWRR